MNAAISKREKGRGEATRCPLCFGGLEEGSLQTCGGCRTRYHADCHAELGGCSTLGCAERAHAFEEPRAEAAARPSFEREERIELILKVLLGAAVALGGAGLLAHVGDSFLGGLALAGPIGAMITTVLVVGGKTS